MAYELVSVQQTKNGKISHYESDQRLTVRQALAIQKNQLEMQFSSHSAYRVRRKTPSSALARGYKASKFVARCHQETCNLTLSIVA